MTFQLPKPTNDDIFEDLVCDIYKKILCNPNLQRFGRRGQGQHGIDIIGKDNNTGRKYAIQCKCHTIRSNFNDKLLLEEFKRELNKFDSSTVNVDTYIFVTSTDSSTTVQQEILRINDERTNLGKCNVEIVFWAFIQDHALEDVNLLQKYFFKLLPNTKSEDYSVPGQNLSYRATLSLSHKQLTMGQIDGHRKVLLERIKTTLGVDKVDCINDYVLSIGIHSAGTNFDSLVDLDLCFKELFAREEHSDKQAEKLEILLESFLDLINIKGKISNQIVVYLDCEITFAFLIGIALRKRRFKPVFIFKDQAWNTTSNSLTICESNISEQPPKILTPGGSEVILVYSCNPTIDYKSEYAKFYSLAEIIGVPQVRFILGYGSSEVKNSAHAFSISKEIAHKINSLASWEISKIHLILITPKPLAAAIAYQLNALNLTIIPYFLSNDRKTYKNTGEITNNFLRNMHGKTL